MRAFARQVGVAWAVYVAYGVFVALVLHAAGVVPPRGTDLTALNVLVRYPGLAVLSVSGFFWAVWAASWLESGRGGGG